MSKIHPFTKIHTIEIFTKTKIDITNMPSHPNILFPFNAEKKYNTVILSYNVLDNGLTLRDFIQNCKKQPTRFTLRKINLWNPNDIMLQIISACEFMVKNNLLSPQTNINPNNIWIQYNEEGKMCVYEIYNFENIIEEIQLSHLDERSRNYWAPEILRKYNHVRFFETPYIEPISKYSSLLTRRNTTPSTLEIVYSLGLILYFIVYKEDAFPELRIHEYDWPNFHSVNKYNRNIKLAIQPEIKDRLSLTELSFVLQTAPKPGIFSRIYNCCYKST